jgi:hypothetical protein
MILMPGVANEKLHPSYYGISLFGIMAGMAERRVVSRVASG